MSNTFGPRTLNQHQEQRMQQFLQSADQFELAIQNATPPGRHRSVAMTHMETLVMWVNKGISRENEL